MTRRSDTGPFAIVPEWLLNSPGVTSGEVHLYTLLARYADQEGRAWPSHKTLAERMNCSTRSVERYVPSLVKRGAIIVTERTSEHGANTTSLYTIIRRDPENDLSLGLSVAVATGGEGAHDTSGGQNENQLNESQDPEDETPSARNLNSSGEKMRAWEDFLSRLSSRRSEGIQSPIFNPSSYARKCAQNGGWPPDVDLDVLFDVARAVKFGLGRRVVILPALEDLQDTATYFQKCRQVAGKDFVAWLNDTVSVVEIMHGSVGDDKLLLHALTGGKLERYADWQAQHGDGVPQRAGRDS